MTTRPTDSDHRLTAEDLLTSPRGRSLVFGLDLNGREDEFDEEAEPLTAHADVVRGPRCHLRRRIPRRPGTGAGVAMYLGDGDSQPEPGDATARDVAATLRRVTPVTPSQAELENEMDEVISGAMYWQPPDGDDQIAADPEVREALCPFAEVLTSTGLLDAWSEPLDPDDQ